jgi:hypothetical protein
LPFGRIDQQPQSTVQDSVVRDIDNLTDADALALFTTPPSGGISWMPNRSMFGEIFFFSEEQWAKNARADILNNSATKPLLDADPPGVILMYLDPKTGQFRQFKAVAAPSAGAPTKLGL